MKTKNKCLVTSLAIIAMLMMSLGVKAQNVTIGPDNGNIITGVAGGNSADSGMGRGMGSMWRHEQLALMVTTSDIANLTSGGELADPSNAIDVYDIDGENGTTTNGVTVNEPKRLIIGAGQTQTFMVVSLPKGYRITGYRLVLKPNIHGNITLHPNNPSGTNNSWAIGEDDTMCFYETPAWSSGSPYGGNTHSNQLTCPNAIATATAADGSGNRMQNDNNTNRAKEYIIERTSMSPTDMSNQLYFFFASSGNNRNTPYQYAVSIISFEIQFTAQGTFEAEVTPNASGTAVSMVESPFSTSKIDIGKLEPQTAHDNNNNTFTVYGYNYSNVRDLIAYNYLYQEDAVVNGVPTADATNKHIYPVAVDGKGAYAFGNGTYYVEPPVTIRTTVQTETGEQPWDSPIGFRVVGAKFECDWGTKTPGGSIPIPDYCTVSVSNNRYLNDNLDFVQASQNNAFQWKIDEYGNLYTGDSYRHYLSCFGTGNTRILSLSSSATGDGAKYNLRINNNNRLVYHSNKKDEAEAIAIHIGSTSQEDLQLYDLDHDSDIDDHDVALASEHDYLLYYISIQEGNDTHLRGYVQKDRTNDLATVTTSTGTHSIDLPSFYPGEYTLVIYDEKGAEKKRIPVNASNAGTDATKYTLTGLNNDALKFGIEGLEAGQVVEKDENDNVIATYTCEQALVKITLMLEALNPYIDKMDIVCNDIPRDPNQEEPNLTITQTFTADDFSVSGGKFIFYVPTDYAEEDLLFSFKDLYSKYGDNTYYDDDASLQMNGNGRYSFVTSDYFKKVSGNQKTQQELQNLGMTANEAKEWPVNNGLYDLVNYNNQIKIGSNGPDAGTGNYYPYSMKVNTSTAGTVRFKFNNADELEGAHTGSANLKEFAFTVDTYLNNYSDPDAANPATAEKAKFKQCVLNAKPNLDQHSGIYYVFTADETRYNIAPTTAWQHRFYAFYRMDIELRAKTFEPNFTWTKIYDKTFYNDGTKDTEDSMWGLTLDVKAEDGGDVEGYLTYQEIIDNIMGREASGSLAAIPSALDPDNEDAPASMKQILYVDGTKLYAMLNSSQNSVVKKLEDLKLLLPANSLVILPENTKSLLDNVAYETTSNSTTRSFTAGKDIVLTDRQPFFSPYKIQVDAANKAIYRREQSGPNTFKLVDHATVVLPFTLSVNGGKHTNLTDDGFAFNLRTLKKLRTPINNNYYEGDGYFDLYTKDEEDKDVTQTKANQPYMVEVVQGESDDYSFIATQYGAVIEPTPSVSNTNGKGIGVKNFESVIEKNLPNAAHLTSYGTYSGSKVPIENGIYYFNQDRFYCSTILEGKYTVVNVRPFRAYYSPTSVSATAKMTGFSILYDLFSDDGGITTSLTETSKPRVMTINTSKGSMLITATENIPVTIMSVNGLSVDNFNMNAGEQRQVNLPSGIYIVNNTKILVK